MVSLILVNCLWRVVIFFIIYFLIYVLFIYIKWDNFCIIDLILVLKSLYSEIKKLRIDSLWVLEEKLLLFC